MSKETLYTARDLSANAALNLKKTYELYCTDKSKDYKDNLELIIDIITDAFYVKLVNLETDSGYCYQMNVKDDSVEVILDKHIYEPEVQEFIYNAILKINRNLRIEYLDALVKVSNILYVPQNNTLREELFRVLSELQTNVFLIDVLMKDSNYIKNDIYNNVCQRAIYNEDGKINPKYICTTKEEVDEVYQKTCMQKLTKMYREYEHTRQYRVEEALNMFFNEIFGCSLHHRYININNNDKVRFKYTPNEVKELINENLDKLKDNPYISDIVTFSDGHIFDWIFTKTDDSESYDPDVPLIKNHQPLTEANWYFRFIDLYYKHLEESIYRKYRITGGVLLHINDDDIYRYMKDTHLAFDILGNVIKI